MPWPEIGVATGILTLATALVYVTRYITQLQSQVRLERLELEKSQAEKARSDIAAAHTVLLEELAAARRTGSAASAKKGEIDEELRALIKLSSADSGSVYIPLRDESRDEVRGLVFAAIEPITEQTIKLRKMVIPLASNAGRCFTADEPKVHVNAKVSQEHYDKADQVSGYHTQDMLNVPLRMGAKVVGVLQLLNKKGGERFSQSDLDKSQKLSTKIAAKVNEFSLLPGSLEVLGIVPETAPQYATILFCDLTASAVLFRELNVAAALQHINEYLESLCDIAFRCGATVDKYIGDGVLFRFNVPHPVENHPLVAVQAALEMHQVFDRVKKDWLTRGEPVAGLHTRAGLAYGAVQKVTLGHPQFQSLTVFGMAVNAAVNLCESAPRDRNVVIIDQLLYAQVAAEIRATPIPDTQLGKARNYTSSAYEVLSKT